MKLYVIFDEVAEKGSPVFEAVNDSVAIRHIRDMIKDMSVHVLADYVLRCVGEIDEKTMVITPDDFEVTNFRSLYDSDKFDEEQKNG